MNNDLYKALKEGVVTVEFTKIDTGELRVMPCTLNQDIHKQRLDMKNYTSNDTMIMYGHYTKMVSGIPTRKGIT